MLQVMKVTNNYFRSLGSFSKEDLDEFLDSYCKLNQLTCDTIKYPEKDGRYFINISDSIKEIVHVVDGKAIINFELRIV